MYILFFFIFIFLIFTNYYIENEHVKSIRIEKTEGNNNNYSPDSLSLVYKLEVIPEIESNLYYCYNNWPIFVNNK